MSDEQRRLATQLEVGSPGSVQGAYAIWLRTPEIAERALQYEQVLYGNLAVSLPFRELVVLVAARFWTADALWTEHRDRALDAGLSADLIAAIAEQHTPRGASADEALVHAFANALLTRDAWATTPSRWQWRGSDIGQWSNWSAWQVFPPWWH